jgi:hypothetical protein
MVMEPPKARGRGDFDWPGQNLMEGDSPAARIERCINILVANRVKIKPFGSRWTRYARSSPSSRIQRKPTPIGSSRFSARGSADEGQESFVRNSVRASTTASERARTPKMPSSTVTM